MCVEKSTSHPAHVAQGKDPLSKIRDASTPPELSSLHGLSNLQLQKELETATSLQQEALHSAVQGV